MRVMKYLAVAALVWLATSASALEADLRDNWVGEYVGTCDLTYGGDALKDKQFNLTIRKGKDLRLAYNYNDRSYHIDIMVTIPGEYQKIKAFTLSESSIKLAPTAGRPQELMIARATGPFNGEIFKGRVVFYRLTPEGKASTLIEVSQFAAGLKN